MKKADSRSIAAQFRAADMVERVRMIDTLRSIPRYRYRHMVPSTRTFVSWVAGLANKEGNMKALVEVNAVIAGR